MVVLKEAGRTPTLLTVKRASTFRQRLIGLMFQRQPLQTEGLHLIPCNSIHMFFMYFSIDVLFLDKNSQVVKKVENLRPWTFIPPVKNAHSTVECPTGTISSYGIKVGDYLII